MSCIQNVCCACCAGASPLEVNTALMSAGSWGVVHEPNASGPLNADVLDDTNNVMVNTAMFHAVTFQPESLQVWCALRASIYVCVPSVCPVSGCCSIVCSVCLNVYVNAFTEGTRVLFVPLSVICSESRDDSLSINNGRAGVNSTLHLA